MSEDREYQESEDRSGTGNMAAEMAGSETMESESAGSETGESEGWQIPQKEKFNWKKELWEWVKIIVSAAVIALVLNTLLLRTVRFPVALWRIPL